MSPLGYKQTLAGLKTTSALHPGADLPGGVAEGRFMVESGCGAVAVGSAHLFPPLSSGGASIAEPLLRFLSPLIEPDVRISRIRLSDWLHLKARGTAVDCAPPPAKH